MVVCAKWVKLLLIYCSKVAHFCSIAAHLNHPDFIRQSPHSILTCGRASARHLKTGLTTSPFGYSS